MPHLETESAKQLPPLQTRAIFIRRRELGRLDSLWCEIWIQTGAGRRGSWKNKKCRGKFRCRLSFYLRTGTPRRVSLPLSLEIFFLRDYHGNPFPDTCHISPPVKIHFPEHDTFEDAARAAHYPLPALHPPLSFSLSMLSIRFEIVKFHRFTNYRSRSPLLHSKVVSVSIRISLIFFLRSSFVGGNVFRRLGSRG